MLEGKSSPVGSQGEGRDAGKAERETANPARFATRVWLQAPDHACAWLRRACLVRAGHLPLWTFASEGRTASKASLRRSIDAAKRPPYYRAPNGPEVNPRGQGPRGYGSAARRVPAFEVRGAGRRDATQVPLREPARPAGRSRAAPGSTSS